MGEPFEPGRRSWPQKFQCAFIGIWLGVRGQSSFAVQIAAATLVILAAAGLRVDWVRWCVLLACVTQVLAAEMFNSALEHLAKAVDRSENPHIAVALDVGSAAVLIASMGAAIIGAIVLGPPVLTWLEPQ